MTTFQDHAARYAQCAGPPSVPADGRRRFVAWRAAAGTALGNALNILAHAYFVALWSRRELIVGPGLVPDLLCGRWGVITRCGLPRWTDGAVSLALNGTKDADPLHWIEHVHEADSEGGARVVGANIHWSSYSGYAQVAAKEPRVMCALQALGCDGPVRDAHNASNRSAVPASMAFSQRFGVEERGRSAGVAEANGCVMAAIMRALLPDGPVAREPVAAAALASARADPAAEHGGAWRWRGSADALAAALRGERAFAGALHFRLMSPSFEHQTNDGERAASDAFFGWLVNASDFWRCVAPANGSAPTAARPTLFVASDARDLCRLAAERLDGAPAPWAIACADAVPMHLARDHRVTDDIWGSYDDEYARAANASALHPHQHVALDWLLLSRSHVLTSIYRAHLQCKTANVGGRLGPGQSFYAWARAASGLGFAPTGTGDPVWDRCHRTCGPCTSTAKSRPSGC